MDTIILVGHRAERYDGEYSPEVLAALDEIGNDENPDYLKEQLKKAQDSKEFAALATLTLRVPDKSVWDALYPNRAAMSAEVVNSTTESAT